MNERTAPTTAFGAETPWALVIRDAVYDRLVAIPHFDNFKTKRKTSMPTLIEDQLPALSVYFLGEDDVPEGDGNTGRLSFIKDPIIGVAVNRAFSDPVQIEGEMGREILNIQQYLLTDNSFTNRWPGTFFFESIQRMQVSWVHNPEGEAFSAEFRLAITFRFREDYEPTITDTFTEYHMETALPPGGTQQEIEATQQTTVDYNLPQD